jgi:hypothetical protein
LTGYVGGNDALVGVGSAWSDFLINGVSVAKTSNSFIKGQRVKMKFVSSSPFTDNVTIFSNYLIKEMTKGIIYKVTCYLGGQIVAQYDFENPKTVVGSSVLPNPVNLIPSFEDARWSLHANAKVLGKDFLHLDATTGQQDSTIILPVQPNTNYQLLGNLSNGSYLGGKLDNVNFQWATISAPTQPFKTASNQTSVTIYLRSTVAGSFDFLKPQLYQLSGLEGTLSGTPQPQTKQSKRSLYAKR